MSPRGLTAGLALIALLAGCAIDREGRFGKGIDGALPDGGPRDVPDPDVGRRPDVGPAPDAGPCDPRTIGSPCDGDDLDLCPDDVYECVAERAVCSLGDDDLERCGGDDEDCDPSTTENDAFDRNSYYTDADGDRYGDPKLEVRACVAPPGTVNVEMATDCDDTDPAVNPGAGEACNAGDDDCDATIDEAPIDVAACPCATAHRDGHTYLICSDRSWADAAMFCAARGYHLARIDDMAENDFIEDEVNRISSSLIFWIGLADPVEATYTWQDGSAPGYTRWDSGEPDDGSPTQDCVGMVASSGRWRTERCSGARPFVCEYP